MDQDNKTGEVTTSMEGLVVFDMLLSDALFEILADKGLVTRAEVTDRIKK